MSNDINERAELWHDSPKLLDPEDSRTLINAYNARLMPDTSGLYDPLDISAVPVLLGFVVDLLAPGTDDLYPTIFRNTINRFWESLGRHFQQEKELQNTLAFGRVLLFFR